MFSHATVNRGPGQSGTRTAPARVPQRSSTVRPRPQTGTVRPLTPSNNPRTPVSRSSYAPMAVSEQYTNRAYNRQPSPQSRFPRPPPPPPPTQSEMARPKLLDSCRPQRPQRSESTGSLTSQRVLVTVKDVLSRAVLERGKIDEDNLGTIIRNMKSRLFGDDAEDDSRPSIDIEMKESRMMVNIEVSSEDLPVKKDRPTVGIVRRPVCDPPPKPYNRVYRSELPAARAIKTLPDGDEVVYIDLPDSDYSNFSSMMKKDKEKSRSNVPKDAELIYEERDGSVGRETQRKEIKHDETPYNDQVGDYHPSDMYKASDDLKLQRYIETLIRNMNDQLAGKKSCGNIEAELDNKNTICKSFCLCKVCVSNTASSRKSSKGSKMSLAHSRPDDDVQSRASVLVESSAEVVESPRQKVAASPTPRRPTTSPLSSIRVVKKSGPAEGSPRARAVRAVALPTEPKESYTVVEPGQTEEAGDDMYLQRRHRSPTRKR